MNVYVGIWRVQYEGDTLCAIASTPALAAADNNVTDIEEWAVDGEFVRKLTAEEFYQAWMAARPVAEDSNDAHDGASQDALQAEFDRLDLAEAEDACCGDCDSLTCDACDARDLADLERRKLG